MSQPKTKRGDLDWAKDGLQNIWKKCLTYGAEKQFVGADQKFAQEAVDALYKSSNPADQYLANHTVGQFTQRGMKLQRREGLPLRPFAIEDMKPYWGYDPGTRWNGWAEPLVTISELRKIATDPESPLSEKMAREYDQGYWFEIPEAVIDEDGDEVPPTVTLCSIYDGEITKEEMKPISVEPMTESGYVNRFYDISLGYIWSWWSPAEILAESIIREVAADEKLSQCKSFAQLHDVCDANLLGDLSSFDAGDDLEAETMNAALEIFDFWAGSDERRPPYDLNREEK